MSIGAADLGSWVTIGNYSGLSALGTTARMEIDAQRSHWERADSNVRKALWAIREFIDYLEKTERELCLESARLSSDETVEFIGPGTEVALTGIVHAINYLMVCRTRIQETDLVLTTRFLAGLETG